jgi:hypothetical protein
MGHHKNRGYPMLPKNYHAPTTPNAEAACMDIGSPVVMWQCWPILLSIALLALGACTVPISQATDKSTGFIKELPDGCYWYRHIGPVETTMLPLLTVEGRPICTQVAAKPPVTG